ncbi:polysaccharide lyase family 7 protein [Bacteroidota bacterium]
MVLKNSNPFSIIKNLKFLPIFLLAACLGSGDKTEYYEVPEDYEKEIPETPETPPTPQFATIDFTNWKVTLPVDIDKNGKPDEYQPSQLVDNGYQTLAAVKPYMYDDTSDGSIVFYTFPDESTANSKYSRTELRELINPKNSKENWTLEEGGTLDGKLKMVSITKDSESSNEFHRTIIMQIHGIISQEDMDKHGFDSNNGPPLLKMYWLDGDVIAYKKSLKNEATSGDDLLETSSATWTDIKHNFGHVGYDAFDLKIVASKGKLSVQLNDNTPHVFQDVSLDKWPYENYFKAGNYLVSTQATAKAYLKYYSLSVSH